MNKIKIRTPKQNELDKIALFHSLYFEPWFSKIDKFLFMSYISRHTEFVKIASLHNSVLGFIIGTITNSEKARIYSIVVDPPHQRKNIGKSLVNSLEDTLKEKMKLKYLTVRISNDKFKTKGFFTRLGFKVVSILNCYERNSLSFQETRPSQHIIRKATIEDIPSIIEVENACFSHFWRMKKEELIPQLSNPLSIIFVACNKEKILGYNYSRVSKNVGNYIRIATHPSEQHNHVAKSLTSRTFSWFRSLGNVTKVLLSTYADSLQHNEMYQKWGFKLVDKEMILTKKYS